MFRDVGTGPAWQVRESARQKLLKVIQQKIISLEDEVGRTNLLRLFLHMTDKRLRCGQVSISNAEFDNVPPTHMELALELFYEISKSVQQFQRSETEGLALFAKLFEWVASGLVWKYHSRLQTQEMHYPKLVYGVENRMEKVPLE